MIDRRSVGLSLVVAGVVALAACGSNVNTPQGQFPPTPGVVCGGKQNLTGEGSTAQTNAITQFATALQAQCPQNRFSYTPSGSGAGVKQFSAGQVDIGGSDSPLSPVEAQAARARCRGNPALHLPLVFGPISLAYNVAGVRDLVLSPEVAARIFSGKIAVWNDPAIVALNPGKPLPAAPIKVFYRSEESGTTDNFQTYLAAAAPQVWTTGAGKTFTGRVPGAEGRAKSQGLATAVKNTPNSITYNEASYAQQSGLGIAQLNSGAGPVPLTTQTATTAISQAQFKPSSNPNDLVLDLNSIYTATVPGAYPLVLVSYNLVCSSGYDPATATAVKAFAKIAAGGGQAHLAQVGYLPLPPQLRDRVNTAINSMP